MCLLFEDYCILVLIIGWGNRGKIRKLATFIGVLDSEKHKHSHFHTLEHFLGN